MESVLKFFPERIKKAILEKFREGIYEIRVRVGKPIILLCDFGEVRVNSVPCQREILEILQFLCDNSVYSFQNQICNRVYYS